MGVLNIWTGFAVKVKDLLPVKGHILNTPIFEVAEYYGAYTHITEFVNMGTAQEYRRDVAIIHEGTMFIARDPEMVL